MADDPSIRPPLEDRHECPICGTYNPPEETACSLCGTTLSPDKAQPPHNQADRDSQTEQIEQIEQIEEEEPTLLSPPLSPAKPAHTQAGPTGSQWISLVGGAITLLLLFLASTMFLSGSGRDAPKETTPLSSPPTAPSGDTKADPTADSGIDAGQDSTAPQSDGSDVSAPPSSPTAARTAHDGQVKTAEDLLPIQFYGVQESNGTAVRAMVRSQVEALSQQILRLYNEGLATAPHQSGVVVLEFSLDTNGRVSRAAVHPTGIITAELQQAIQSVVTQWQFRPTQTQEITVFYPVLLTPSRVEPTRLLSHFTDVWPGRYKILNATPIPVYGQSSDSAQEIGTIGAGLFVYVISSQDGWLGVLSPTGKVGYVRREHLFPRA